MGQIKDRILALGLMVLAGFGATAHAVDVQFEAGLNLFSYPVAVPPGLTCEDLRANLGAESVARLNAGTQLIETCEAGTNEFAIVAGEGYLIEMAAATLRSFTGDDSCPTLQLEPGVNLIGVPTPDQGLSCFSMLDRVDTADAIRSVERFAQAQGLFQACAPTTGSDFAIIPGEAYLVSVAGSGQVNLDALDAAKCLDCPVPTITSVTPPTGSAGTIITITGTGLDCGDLAIRFGDLNAPILSRSGTEITTMIPIGADNGAFSLFATGGNVTVPPEFEPVIVPSRDFSLNIPDTFNTLVRGAPFSLLVEAAGSDDFSELIDLEITGMSPGVSATIVPSTITAGQIAVVRFAVDENAALTTFDAVVTGTASVDASPVVRADSAALEVVADGQTIVQGKFHFVDGTPMSGIELTLDNVTTFTDDAGNFRIEDPPAGLQTLSIDTTPVDPALPMYAVDITIAAGVLTQLPPFVHHPIPEPEAFTPLVQAAPVDQFFESLDAPGAMITLPAGETIVGWDGTPKTQLAIVRRDPDKLPVPPPPGPTKSLYQPMFGTPMGGIPSAVLPVTTPNDLDMAPGEVGDIWYYDAAPLPGAPGQWVNGGTATVSADGTSIVSDPGSGIGRFCGVCGLWCIVKRQFGQLNFNFDGPFGGDPVSLPLGQMITTKTDLFLDGRVPAVVERIHNPFDPFGGTAGVQLGLGTGWTLSVDLVLQEESNELIRLVMPGNARYDFVRQPDDSYREVRNQRFAGAVITREFEGLRLRYKDGSAVLFRESSIFGLDDVHFAVSFSDRNGNRLTVERDADDRITRIVEPAGRALSFTYGANNLIESISDPIGRSVSYTYNGNRIDTVTDVGGGTTRYTYNADGGILTITDPKNIEWLRMEYDANGRVAKQIQPDGGEWTFEYLRPCEPGEVPHPLRDECPLQADTEIPTSAVVTDPLGNPTITGFGAAGSYANEITDALGQRTIVRRDERGQVLQLTDPLGRKVTAEYDDRGNLTEFVDALNNPTSFEYEPTFNQVTRIIDALAHETEFEYDASGNLSRIIDPLNFPVSLSYDQFGQVTSYTDALNNTTSYQYDDFGNPIVLQDPIGNRTELSFDPVSRLVSAVDALGRRTQIEYGAFDQALAVVDPLGQSTLFEYDENGNILTVTDASGNTTTYVYNNMDQVSSRVDANSVPEFFEYDLFGNLSTITNRRGEVATYSYDAVNRIVRADFADATVNYAYDAVGRLTQIDDSVGGSLLYIYDALDRVIQEVSPNSVISYEYDPIDRRTSMTVGDEVPVTYSYDARSLLTSISQGPLVATFSYDEAGRRTSLTLPNDVVTAYSYDAASRLVELLYEGPAGNALGSLTYAYDSVGNRRQVGGSFAATLLPEAVDSAGYVPGNRQSTFGDRTMTFDANGNVISITDPAGATNLTWDSRDRLIEVTGPSLSASFSYDAFGRRTEKIVGAEQSAYVYDTIDIAQLRDDSGLRNFLRTLVVDELLFINGEAGPILDALGSTVVRTAGDGSASPQTLYTPYGVTDSQGADPAALFTGREADETGFYNYRARYYDPYAKRFLSEDPLGFGAYDPNYYAYVSGDPVNATDPTGEIAPIAGRLLGGCLIGAAFGGLEIAFNGRKDSPKQMLTSLGIGCALGAGLSKLGGSKPRVFWSGPGAKEAAEAFAKANGGKTLEMTLAGKILDKVTTPSNFKYLKPLWNAASQNFARGAKGQVNVFQSNKGVRLESVWAKREFPILKQQKNKIKYHIVK